MRGTTPQGSFKNRSVNFYANYEFYGVEKRPQLGKPSPFSEMPRAFAMPQVLWRPEASWRSLTLFNLCDVTPKQQETEHLYYKWSETWLNLL